jgi:osmotically-inducible protein OsmY
MKTIIKKSLVVLACLLGSSCVPVLLAGAAGGYIIYDDRSVRTIEKDARIFHVIHRALVRNSQMKHGRINVTSYKQVVLLTGQVPYASERAIAEKIARSAPNVRKIYNEITIEPEISALQVTKDTGITSNVRSHMLAKKNLDSGGIRIVTENAVVYLMGDVSHPQAELSVSVAREIQGVRKVVKVFQYIDN